MLKKRAFGKGKRLKGMLKQVRHVSLIDFEWLNIISEEVCDTEM